MKTKLKTENMMPQNANENKNSKEKIEKRKEAKEIKTKEKRLLPRTCACVREEAAADPSGLDAKSAAALKREVDELIRENYALVAKGKRTAETLRCWYFGLRRRNLEISALKREVETLKTENGELRKQLAALMLEAGELRERNASLSGFVGSLCDLVLALDAAVKRFQAKCPDGLPPEAETEGGAE